MGNMSDMGCFVARIEEKMVSGILLTQRNGITHISFDILWCDVLLWISLFSEFQLNWKIFDLEFHLNHIITMQAQVKGVNKIEQIENGELWLAARANAGCWLGSTQSADREFYLRF